MNIQQRTRSLIISHKREAVILGVLLLLSLSTGVFLLARAMTQKPLAAETTMRGASDKDSSSSSSRGGTSRYDSSLSTQAEQGGENKSANPSAPSAQNKSGSAPKNQPLNRRNQVVVAEVLHLLRLA